MELKEQYISEFDYSKIKGFVQFFSLKLFAVGLWTEKDVDIFHFNALNFAFSADATGSIAFKVGSKMVLYYSFVLCDKTKKDEPLANVERITDSHGDQPIRNCLHQFITDEKRKYGDNSNSVPILFTCDMSWPILKSGLRCFNNESVEEYITRSYKIAIDQASFSDLPIKPFQIVCAILFISHHAYIFKMFKRNILPDRK